VNRAAAAIVLAALLGTLVLVFAARDGVVPAPSPPPEPPRDAEWSLRVHVQPIFNVACVRCHLHGEAIGSLDLAPEAAYASLVGMPSEQSARLRVAPGSPDSSYLLDKLEGTHLEAGGSGLPMPMDTDRLTDEQLERIRSWIAAGASSQLAWLPICVLVGKTGLDGIMIRRTRGHAMALRYLWLSPVRDLAMAAIWMYAIGARTVEWRGERFRLGKGSQLTPLAAPDASVGLTPAPAPSRVDDQRHA
jgi:mono/diheme cytochrome c family protein